MGASHRRWQDPTPAQHLRAFPPRGDRSHPVRHALGFAPEVGERHRQRAALGRPFPARTTAPAGPRCSSRSATCSRPSRCARDSGSTSSSSTARTTASLAPPTWTCSSAPSTSPSTPLVDGYAPLFGVLWDMVGDRDLKFEQEANSLRQAPEVVSLVWETARGLGYGNTFVPVQGLQITDDHVPLLDAGLRVIDVIDLDYPVASHARGHDRQGLVGLAQDRRRRGLVAAAALARRRTGRRTADAID